jgi:hypothetical protein
MKPTSTKIIEDLNRLISTVRIAGDNAMNDDGKKRLSDMIAYTCYELRRKYELTSQYFFIAECNAQRKYGEEYDKE